MRRRGGYQDPFVPNVTGSKAQPTTGKAAKPKGAPYRDVKHGQDTYRVYPDGTMKNLTPGKAPKPAPGRPAAPAAPVADQAQTEIDTQYAPHERKLIDLIGQGGNHQTMIDRVYAGYKQSHDQQQGKVTAATAGALAGMQASAADSLGAAGADADAANAQGAAKAATVGGDGDPQKKAAAEVIAALAGSQQQNAISQGGVQAQGNVDAAAIGRLGLIAEGQKGLYHESTNAYVNSLKGDQLDMGLQKGRDVAGRRTELDGQKAAALQQKITNNLAALSLAQKGSLAEKELELEGDKLAQQVTENDLDRTSREDIATSGQKATATEARRRRAFEKSQAARKAKTDKELKLMDPATGGKGGPSSTRTFQTAAGSTVPMTPANMQAWNKARNSYASFMSTADTEFAHVAGEGKLKDAKLFNEVVTRLVKKYGATNRPALRAAAYAAQHPGPVSGEFAKILRMYFPGGLVPSYLATGGGFTEVRG